MLVLFVSATAQVRPNSVLESASRDMIVADASPTVPDGPATSSAGTDDSAGQVAHPATPDPAGAPQPATHHRGFFRSIAHDEYRIWTAPFRRTNYDSHAMRKYGLPFALISAGAIATDAKTATWLPNTRDQAIWSGKVSQMGAAYTLAGFSGVTWLLGAAKHDRHAKETGLLALEALAHAQVVAFAIKQVTQRERPIEEKRRIGFWKGGDSFPSGHATSSFAVAAVFAYEYRDHIAVPIAAYSLASIISASRMSARRHWVSDLFAGGSLGFMLGRYVYKQHHDPDLPGSHVERRAHLMPDIGVGQGGLALSWLW